MHKVFFAVIRNSDNEIVEAGWTDQAGFDAISPEPGFSLHETESFYPSRLYEFDGTSFTEKSL